MEDREGSESVKSTVRVDKREKSVYETETKKKQEIMRERERNRKGADRIYVRKVSFSAVVREKRFI